METTQKLVQIFANDIKASLAELVLHNEQTITIRRTKKEMNLGRAYKAIQRAAVGWVWARSPRS
jgi:hypothetical protein